MLSGIRADETRMLIRRLWKICMDCRKDEELDLAWSTVEMKSLLSDLTLNVMMRMIAGKRYYGVGEEEEEVVVVEEARRFQEIVAETFRVYGMSNFGDFVAVMRWLGGSKKVERKMVELQEKRDAFMQELINQHRRRKEAADGSEEKTMIDVLLKLQETEPECYKDEDIRSLVLVLLAAGTDTTAKTMESAMLHLIHNPNTLKKAQAEIDNQAGRNRLFQESDLNNLPYLQCIINETLRLCPAAPMLTPHESSKECVVGGYHIPRSTMLLVNVWGIQNDPKIWDEPEKFKPERFDGVETNKFVHKLIPFGVGRRACPGEGLAIRIVGLVLGSLLQCFNWEKVGEESVEELTMPMAKPFQAKCQPRQAMIQLASTIGVEL